MMEDARLFIKAVFIDFFFLPTRDRRTEKHAGTHTVLAFYHLLHMDNVSANSCLFTQAADPEQNYVSIGSGSLAID